MYKNCPFILINKSTNTTETNNHLNKMEKSGLGLETELTLGLPGRGGYGGDQVEKNEKKRMFSDISSGGEEKSVVVGWPPVCAYRRKSSFSGMKVYVKVSMDGEPFLRKIDLSNRKGYSDLAVALEELFGCFGIGEALKDAENSEYVPIYEDKDGDWMLVGDVPWGMFMESCRRLRIMKRSEAKGIGLRAEDLFEGMAKE